MEATLEVTHRIAISRHPLLPFYLCNYSTAHIRVIKDFRWRYNELLFIRYLLYNHRYFRISIFISK